MKPYWVLVVCLAMGVSLPVRAQQKSEKIVITPALEKELYAVDLKWMKAEADKKTSTGQHGRTLDG